jgi:hypothetical protein
VHSKKLVPLGLVSSLDWQVLEGIGMDKTVCDSNDRIVQPVAERDSGTMRRRRD